MTGWVKVQFVKICNWKDMGMLRVAPIATTTKNTISEHIMRLKRFYQNEKNLD